MTVEQRCDVRAVLAYSWRRTHTGVHSSNTGKLWNYTGNQNSSSPRGGCRAGILTCFRLSDPLKKKTLCQRSVACSSARVCVHVHVWSVTKRDSRTEVRGSVCTCLFVETNSWRRTHTQLYIQATLVGSGTFSVCVCVCVSMCVWKGNSLTFLIFSK